MQLEEYFDFDNPNGIRIKGTRINLEHIVYEAREGLSADDIVADFHPSLTLEQVHAALAYYYHNRSELDAYVARQQAKFDAAKQTYEQAGPPAAVTRLRDEVRKQAVR